MAKKTNDDVAVDESSGRGVKKVEVSRDDVVFDVRLIEGLVSEIAAQVKGWTEDKDKKPITSLVMQGTKYPRLIQKYLTAYLKNLDGAIKDAVRDSKTRKLRAGK